MLLDQSEADRLVLITPEIGKGQLPVILQRLNKHVQYQVGITLRCGVASFPEDGVTFEALLDQAEQTLQAHVHKDKSPEVIELPEVIREQPGAKTNGRGPTPVFSE